MHSMGSVIEQNVGGDELKLNVIEKRLELYFVQTILLIGLLLSV